MLTNAMNSRRVLCIALPVSNKYSETFIRAHIERLQTVVKVLYGRPFPAYTGEDDRPLLPWLQYAANIGLSRLLGVEQRRFHQVVLQYYPTHFRNGVLRRYLQKHQVQAVLAEYGHVGVAVM